MALPLVGLVAVWLARVFTFETAKYLAFRTMLIIVVLGLGPIVIFKGLSFMLKFMGTYGSSFISSIMGSFELEAPVVNLWGVGAYLGGKLKVVEGISIFISFLVLKFTWSLLPRWGIPTGLTKY